MKILLSEIMLVRFILKTKCKLKIYFCIFKDSSKSRMIIFKDEEKLEFLKKTERERLTVFNRYKLQRFHAH